jgi:hypothetical protein
MSAKTAQHRCRGCLLADMVAYNGASARRSRTEALVTGVVVKVTKDYVHIRRYEDKGSGNRHAN